MSDQRTHRITRLAPPAHEVDSDATPVTPPPLACGPALLAILDSGPQQGETIDVGFRRIERELRALFARLPVVEARNLHARLERRAANDPIATSFGRLIAERRSRLIAFLANARRRAASGFAIKEHG